MSWISNKLISMLSIDQFMADISWVKSEIKSLDSDYKIVTDWVNSSAQKIQTIEAKFLQLDGQLQSILSDLEQLKSAAQGSTPVAPAAPASPVPESTSAPEQK